MLKQCHCKYTYIVLHIHLVYLHINTQSSAYSLFLLFYSKIKLEHPYTYILELYKYVTDFFRVVYTYHPCS